MKCHFLRLCFFNAIFCVCAFLTMGFSNRNLINGNEIKQKRKLWHRLIENPDIYLYSCINKFDGVIMPSRSGNSQTQKMAFKIHKCKKWQSPPGASIVVYEKSQTQKVAVAAMRGICNRAEPKYL